MQNILDYDKYLFKFDRKFIYEKLKKLGLKVTYLSSLMYPFNKTHVATLYNFLRENPAYLRKISIMCYVLECSPNDLFVTEYKNKIFKIKESEKEKITIKEITSLNEEGCIIKIVENGEYEKKDIEW